VSDQERDKYGKDEEEGADDVEAHKHGHRDADISPTDDDSDAVEAHKDPASSFGHGGKDS
jgi:hypothetical protein